MKVRIKETGKIKTLSIIDTVTGVNWVSDFIGNTGALQDGQFTEQEDGTYLADAETFQWWSKVVEDREALDVRIKEMTAVYGSEVIADIVQDSGNVDLEDYADVVNQALDAFENDKTPAK